MFVVSVLCCQVEVSATCRSLVQRSPTDCGASLCMITSRNNPLHLNWLGRKKLDEERRLIAVPLVIIVGIYAISWLGSLFNVLVTFSACFKGSYNSYLLEDAFYHYVLYFVVKNV